MYSLWLRDELFLLGHDDGGKAVIHEASLSAGLAGAVLMDLLFCGRLRVSTGRTFVADRRATGDAAADSVVESLVRGAAPDGVKALVRWLAQDSYERASAMLVAAGLLRKTTTRRLGLVPVTRYQIVEEPVVVRVRARLRAVVHGREPADPPIAALCALIRVVRLDSQLVSPLPAAELLARLDLVASGLDPALRQVVDGVDTAVAAYALSAFR